MNILVTGAAGFIGGHFLDACKEINVFALDKITYAASPQKISQIFNSKIPFLCFGIEETNKVINAIIKNNINLVVNFAAETHVDNSIIDCKPFIQSNFEGIHSILEACKFTKTKLIQISTDEVYGPAEGLPFLEQDRFNPQNPYSATKAAAEHLIQSYANTFGVKYLIIRPTNNFGPFQNCEKFIPKYISSLLQKRKFPLYGDGKQIREWFFVRDCARVILSMVKNHVNLKHSIYNIGAPKSSMHNIEVCRKIYDILNVDAFSFEESISFVKDRPGHDRKYSINIDKMLDELKEFKFTNMDDALLETINYYQGIFA